MQNGGNEKALDFFKKNSIVSDTNKNIDYKQAIVQRYKNDLLKKVEALLPKYQKEQEIS